MTCYNGRVWSPPSRVWPTPTATPPGSRAAFRSRASGTASPASSEAGATSPCPRVSCSAWTRR